MSNFPNFKLHGSGLALLFLMLLADPALAASDRPPSLGLGSPASRSQIARWDIDVRPDGIGLPVGHGSVEEGQLVYDEKCAACHGTFGESGDYAQLAGGVGSLHSAQPVRTVGSVLSHATTLWDYINRAMPFPNSKSLTPHEVYAVTAYVLSLNDIVPPGTVLNERSLPGIAMPNQSGFTTHHGFMAIRGEPDVKNSACMKNCTTSTTIISRLPADFTAKNYGNISQEFRSLNRDTLRAETPIPSMPTTPESGPKLALINGCTACHQTEQKIVGPSFKDIAQKYRQSPDALKNLTQKIRAGGAGNWGETPMPPQTKPSALDLDILVRWILASPSHS